MRWKPLAALLGVILLAALAFSVWGPRVSAPTVSGGEPAPALATSPAPAPAAIRRPAPTPAPTRPPPALPAPASDDRARGTPPVPFPFPSPAPAPVAAGAPPTTPEARPTVDAGVTYAVDKDGIRSAIREKVPDLRDCYEPWLLANPELQGRIKVAFTIDEDPDTGLGHVSEIGVLDGGMDHLAMQGCVMNVFKDLRFEAPQHGPVKVNYPLSFWAGDGGA